VEDPSRCVTWPAEILSFLSKGSQGKKKNYEIKSLDLSPCILKILSHMEQHTSSSNLEVGENNLPLPVFEDIKCNYYKFC